MTITFFNKSNKKPTPEEVEASRQLALAEMRDAERSILTAAKMLPTLKKLKARYGNPAIAYDAMVEFIVQQAEWSNTLVLMNPDEALERYQEACRQEKLDDALELSDEP